MNLSKRRWIWSPSFPEDGPARNTLVEKHGARWNCRLFLGCPSLGQFIGSSALRVVLPLAAVQCVPIVRQAIFEAINLANNAADKLAAPTKIEPSKRDPKTDKVAIANR